LASAGRDRSVRVWNLATRKPMDVSLAGHQEEIYSLAFIPGSTALAAGSGAGTIVFWVLPELQSEGQRSGTARMQPGLLSQFLLLAPSEVESVALDQQTGAFIFTGSTKKMGKGAIKWDLTEVGEPARFAESDWIGRTVVSPEGSVVAVSTAE